MRRGTFGADTFVVCKKITRATEIVTAGQTGLSRGYAIHEGGYRRATLAKLGDHGCMYMYHFPPISMQGLSE